MDIRDYLQACHELNASDLHLVKGEPPIMRVDGHILRTPFSPIAAAELTEMLLGLLDDAQRKLFAEKSDVNFALDLPGCDRFRVNIHRQRSAIEAAFRRMPARIPPLRELGLPPSVSELARKSAGLILITGAVGMGKTTSLLSMVEQINAERSCLIVSIEDPIEYLYANKRSIIKQREIGIDTPSFAEALRNALRQDPNVIVISEMRDYETIAIALTAAETGHLVLATLHCPDATQAIQRIVDVFPSKRQQQVRLQLADVLQGVISQVLLPRAHGQGRVLAPEVLIVTAAVRNLIRERKMEQIPSLLETGIKDGMQTRDKAITSLMKNGMISPDTALANLANTNSFVRPPEPRVSEWMVR